jgi:hypothetical protein
MRSVIGVTGDRVRVANEGGESATEPDTESLQLFVTDAGEVLALNPAQIEERSTPAVAAEAEDEPTS